MLVMVMKCEMQEHTEPHREKEFGVLIFSCGTLRRRRRQPQTRHAVIQDEPLWIIFKRDMVITLKQELLMNNF